MNTKMKPYVYCLGEKVSLTLCEVNFSKKDLFCIGLFLLYVQNSTCIKQYYPEAHNTQDRIEQFMFELTAVGTCTVTTSGNCLQERTRTSTNLRRLRLLTWCIGDANSVPMLKTLNER